MAKRIVTIDLGPWEFCDDPEHCNHTSHGSLTRVLDILERTRERLSRENPEKLARIEAELDAQLQERIRSVGPEKWDQMVAEAEARRLAREARRNAAAAASHAG